MVVALTRREWLRRLLMVAAAGPLGGWAKRDPYAERCVCIHVFAPGDPLPRPLLEPPPERGESRPAPRDFEIGLPEILVCSTSVRLFDLHRCFWPFTRANRRTLEQAVSVTFREPAVRAAADVERLAEFLRRPRQPPAPGELRVALIFTLHGGNRRWLPAVVRAARAAAVDEIAILKDPSMPPYLCEYPSRQCKGW